MPRRFHPGFRRARCYSHDAPEQSGVALEHAHANFDEGYSLRFEPSDDDPLGGCAVDADEYEIEPGQDADIGLIEKHVVRDNPAPYVRIHFREIRHFLGSRAQLGKVAAPGARKALCCDSTSPSNR